MRRASLLLALLSLASYVEHGDAAAVATGRGSVELTLTQRNGSPLVDAVLTAERLAGGPLPAAADAVLDQRDKRFVPQVLVVQAGAAVRFTNSDTVSHHVYSIAPAKKFEHYLEKSEPAPSVVFDRPGVVTLGCNLHDWMLAYIVVVPTDRFVKTDAAGRATLGELPPGRYRLAVWHPRSTDPADRLAREVTVAAGGREVWSLRLERALLPARDQVPSFEY